MDGIKWTGWTSECWLNYWTSQSPIRTKLLIMAISAVKLAVACAVVISVCSAQSFFDNDDYFGGDFGDSFDGYYGNDDYGSFGNDDFYGGGIQTFGLPSFGSSLGGMYPLSYGGLGSFGGIQSYGPVLGGGVSSAPVFVGGFGGGLGGGFGGLSPSYGLYSVGDDYSYGFQQPYLGGGAFSLGRGSFIL